MLAAQDDEDEDGDNDSPIDDTPVWLLLTTKHHLVDKSRLKPGKIPVPHSLNNSSSLSICLITADPQRAVKDVVADPSFPRDLASKITKIIGYSKLKARYHSFESRRQLLNDHDVFLADDRIILRLIETLGKTFYKSQGKRPIPIRIAGFDKDPETKKTIKPEKKKPNTPKNKDDQKDAAVASPSVVAAEIQRTLSTIPITLRPGASAAVRVGKQSFTPTQLTENITTVLTVMVEKYIVKGWRNIKAIHIKGPNTAAMPIWLADELWTDQSTDILLPLPTNSNVADQPPSQELPIKQIQQANSKVEKEENQRGTKRKAKHQPPLPAPASAAAEDKPHAKKKLNMGAAKVEEKNREIERKTKLKAMKEKANGVLD